MGSVRSSSPQSAVRQRALSQDPERGADSSTVNKEKLIVHHGGIAEGRRYQFIIMAQVAFALICFGVGFTVTSHIAYRGGQWRDLVPHGSHSVSAMETSVPQKSSECKVEVDGVSTTIQLGNVSCGFYRNDFLLGYGYNVTGSGTTDLVIEWEGHPFVCDLEGELKHPIEKSDKIEIEIEDAANKSLFSRTPAKIQEATFEEVTYIKESDPVRHRRTVKVTLSAPCKWECSPRLKKTFCKKKVSQEVLDRRHALWKDLYKDPPNGPRSMT